MGLRENRVCLQIRHPVHSGRRHCGREDCYSFIRNVNLTWQLDAKLKSRTDTGIIEIEMRSEVGLQIKLTERAGIPSSCEPTWPRSFALAPCHKDLCASSGQNLMCYTEDNGSSFWFMTESSSAPKASEYFHQFGQELDLNHAAVTLPHLRFVPSESCMGAHSAVNQLRLLQKSERLKITQSQIYGE